MSASPAPSAEKPENAVDGADANTTIQDPFTGQSHDISTIFDDEGLSREKHYNMKLTNRDSSRQKATAAARPKPKAKPKYRLCTCNKCRRMLQFPLGEECAECPHCGAMNWASELHPGAGKKSKDDVNARGQMLEEAQEKARAEAQATIEAQAAAEIAAAEVVSAASAAAELAMVQQAAAERATAERAAGAEANPHPWLSAEEL